MKEPPREDPRGLANCTSSRLTDHDHRTAGVSDATFAHRPQQELRHPASAMTSHNEKVGITGGIEQHLDCAPSDHSGVDALRAEVREGISDHLVEFEARLLP